MSKNLQESQSSEEVDLGQLFKLIGNTFNRLFKFIGSILNSLFLAFVWLVFFAKKHILKVIIAAIVGFGIGFVKQYTEDPIYKSMMIVKQNYNTGENLDNTLSYYNNLIVNKDSLALSESLNISPSEANMIVGLELETVLNENQKLKLFNEYTKSIDSTLATTIDFDIFMKNSNEYNYQLQKITIKSYSKRSYENVISQIIKQIESSEFFKNEQKKDLAQLDSREAAIKEALKESDSLQKVYQKVLENSLQNAEGSQTSITIDNKEDKSVTKEFELYNSDINLRRELVSIKRDKEDKEHIFEIVSNRQNIGILDNSTSLLGYEISLKIKYALLLSFLVFLILIARDFLNYLERFKNKI